MEAAKRFDAGEETAGIAADLRVGVRQVEKWRKAWREGGTDARCARRARWARCRPSGCPWPNRRTWKRRCGRVRPCTAGTMAMHGRDDEGQGRDDEGQGRDGEGQGQDGEGQGRTPARVKTLLGRMFYVGCT